MTPARLGEPQLWIVQKERHDAQKEILGRYEVRVEDRQELTADLFHPGRQSARLESLPLVTVYHVHRLAFSTQPGHTALDQLAGFVGGIIEHLHFV